MPRKLSAGRDMSLSRFFCVITLGLTGTLSVGWAAVPVETSPPIGGSAVERLSGAFGEGDGDVGRKARPTGQVIVFGD